MSKAEHLIVPVILSGGAGTRLWPASRHDRPKQFLPLLHGRSTFSNALLRISDSAVYAPPIVMTARDFGFLVASELEQAGLAGSIVMEPVRRDSGPAVAAAAVLAERKSPASLLLVLAADHVVNDSEAFGKAVQDGLGAAAAGSIVTFGIKPDRPSPDYGYIETGDTLAGQAKRVKRFLEKPDVALAEALIGAGCLWNSGNFLLRADVLISELARFEPAMLAAAEAAVGGARMERAGNFCFHTLEESAYSSAPAKSLDYAVMERTRLAAVVPAEFSWADLGSFDALWEFLEKDAAGNAANGDVVLQGTSNSYVSSEGILTAVVGLQDVIVVATADAVLVSERGGAPGLRAIVAALEKTASTRPLTQRHKVSQTHWGWETAAFASDAATARLLKVRPGASVELTHGEPPPCLVICAGVASLVDSGTEFRLAPGQSLRLERHIGSTLSNKEAGWLEALEIRFGS